jgi:hypothetical protein
LIPLPYAAYWVDPSSPTRVLECLPGAACLEKYSEDEVRNRKCAPQRFQGIHTDPAYIGSAVQVDPGFTPA